MLEVADIHKSLEVLMLGMEEVQNMAGEAGEEVHGLTVYLGVAEALCLLAQEGEEVQHYIQTIQLRILLIMEVAVVCMMLATVEHLAVLKERLVVPEQIKNYSLVGAVVVDMQILEARVGLEAQVARLPLVGARRDVGPRLRGARPSKPREGERLLYGPAGLDHRVHWSGGREPGLPRPHPARHPGAAPWVLRAAGAADGPPPGSESPEGGSRR